MGDFGRGHVANCEYHVINRGNDRRHLFRGKGAAAAFERCLAPS